LQEHLVLVPIDKAANNVAFICKRFYLEVLQNELNKQGGAYEIVHESPQDILKRHTLQLTPLGLEGDLGLPYLYWLPKMHKKGQRFIAGSGECSTTTLSKVLADCLLFIQHAVRHSDNNEMCKTGVRKYFTVDSFEEVADFAARWTPLRTRVTSEQGLRTGDFSTMYTTIPHDDLFSKIFLLLDRAWKTEAKSDEEEEHNRIWLQWEGKTKSCCWLRQKTRNEPVKVNRGDNIRRFQKQGLKDLIRFLVDNTYLCNGQNIRKQIRGIPMGTNAAPSLANSYCHCYEFDFISNLLKNPNPQIQRQATAFHLTFRYIDDTLSIDNPFWQHYVSKPAEEGGIYPTALVLNDTSISQKEVHFLGMSIKSNMSNKLNLDVFDKRKEFPFEVRRYPHMDSFIPPCIPYGVFTGQLYRFYNICTGWQAFVANSWNLAEVLIRQGSSANKLVHLFSKFLMKKQQSTEQKLRWSVPLKYVRKKFRSCLGSSLTGQ
jgi:hypothetical protein